MHEVTVTPVVPGNTGNIGTTDTLADVKARLQAAEAQPPEARDASLTPPAPSTVQAQAADTPSPGKPEDANNADDLRKFRNPDGSVGLDKIEKSNEHLRKRIEENEKVLSMSPEDRQAHLLRQQRELRKKFDQTNQAVSQEKSKLNDLMNQLGNPDEITPELERSLLEEMDKSPVKAVARLAKAYAQRDSDPRLIRMMQEWEMEKAARAEKAQVQDLDDLSTRHQWIRTEGLGRFEAVFQRHPELLSLPNPYRAALGYMDDLPAQAQAPASAQGGRTPILSGGAAVPPPSSVPPTSPEQEMQELSRRAMNALKHGDKAAAAELMKKMDRLERGY